MPKAENGPESRVIGIDDLGSDFLTLRIGEIIPRLEIAEIRKVTSKSTQDNLPGVNYRYLIKSKQNRFLTVNSWVLWNQIAALLKEAGRTDVTLELKHIGHGEYDVNLI